jgi:hypothetical protein
MDTRASQEQAPLHIGLCRKVHHVAREIDNLWGSQTSVIETTLAHMRVHPALIFPLYNGTQWTYKSISVHVARSFTVADNSNA